MAFLENCSPCYGTAYRLAAALGAVIVLLAQAGVINYYLVNSFGNKYWAWWVADTFVLGMFIASFVVSIGNLGQEARRNARRARDHRHAVIPGEMPLAYLAWICYSILLSVRVWILFWSAVQSLSEKDFFGPNTLKVAIAGCCVIFLLLVATHHDAEPKSTRELFIRGVVSGVTFDLLDTIAILEVLFIRESHVILTFAMHRTILVIACLNLTLPTLPLLVLSKTRYGRISLTKTFQVIHHLIYLMLINVPLFIVRMLLWHVTQVNISVFLIKNVLGIVFSIKSIIEGLAAAQEERDSLATSVANEPPATEMVPVSSGDAAPDERETDPAFSEAATLPIRSRASDRAGDGAPAGQPRFV